MADDANQTETWRGDTSCETRIYGTCAVFLVYAFILFFKLRQVLAQKKQVESALKSERIYTQWLIRNAAHYPPDYRPPGPREDDV